MHYGVILNDPHSVEKIGSLEDAPYKGAPRAPVLYLKPANTLAGEGAMISLPRGETAVEVAGTLGLVIGPAGAARCTPDNALSHVAGLILACDLSLPHASCYRPAIREKCFDGALPAGTLRPWVDPATVRLTTEIDGQTVDIHSFDDLLRKPQHLLADVTEFMTLNPGDVLLVGVRYQAPQAKTGSRIRLSAPQLGELNFSLVQEPLS